MVSDFIFHLRDNLAYLRDVKTTNCKLAQITTQMVQIWTDLYYLSHYVLPCETLSSLIILVYTS